MNRYLINLYISAATFYYKNENSSLKYLHTEEIKDICIPSDSKEVNFHTFKRI